MLLHMMMMMMNYYNTNLCFKLPHEKLFRQTSKFILPNHKKILYTEWSRGNACFSYKNNFVYFQHTKVLITQKSRYFNGFLRTKLRTENNVSQMTSFLPDTHSEPLLKALHCTLQHFLWQSCDFLTNGEFQLPQCAMATETALSEPSAGSRPTSSTPPLPSTSYLKNLRFLCSTLYYCNNSLTFIPCISDVLEEKTNNMH
jgi:hypothetical protein